MNDRLIDLRDYGTVEKWVLTNPEISVGAKGFYALICSYAGNKDNAYPGTDLICYQLNISKNTLQRYIKELKDNNCIMVTQERNQGKFSHNIYSLLPCTVTQKAVNEKVVNQKLDTKNNSIKNNSNNIYSASNDSTSVSSRINKEQVEKIWKLYPRKEGKKQSMTKIPKIIKEIGEDELIKAIERYKNKIKGQETRFIMQGSTFFNGRYMDYLEDNKEEIKAPVYVPIDKNLNDEEYYNDMF